MLSIYATTVGARTRPLFNFIAALTPAELHLALVRLACLRRILIPERPHHPSESHRHQGPQTGFVRGATTFKAIQGTEHMAGLQSGPAIQRHRHPIARNRRPHSWLVWLATTKSCFTPLYLFNGTGIGILFLGHPINTLLHTSTTNGLAIHARADQQTRMFNVLTNTDRYK